MGLGLSAGGCSGVFTFLGLSGGLGGWWLLVLIGYVVAVLLFRAGWSLITNFDESFSESAQNKLIAILIAIVFGALFFGGCVLFLGN